MTWAEIRAKEDAAAIEEGHDALRATARRLIPLLPDEPARAMRVALLSADFPALRYLINEHWIAP